MSLLNLVEGVSLSRSLQIPNNKIDTWKRVKQFILLMLLDKEDLMFLFTVNTVCNNGETGDIYIQRLRKFEGLAIIYLRHLNYL